MTRAILSRARGRLAAVAVGCAALLTALTACQESMEERCQREAEEYTRKHCPVFVEKEVRMDSMTFDRSSHTISYAYTLSGALDDEQVIKAGNPGERLLSQVKNSTHLKLYKEAGYSFRYVYYSATRKGQLLYDVTFHEHDYAPQK